MQQLTERKAEQVQREARDEFRELLEAKIVELEKNYLERISSLEDKIALISADKGVHLSSPQGGGCTTACVKPNSVSEENSSVGSGSDSESTGYSVKCKPRVMAPNKGEGQVLRIVVECGFPNRSGEAPDECDSPALGSWNKPRWRRCKGCRKRHPRADSCPG